VRGEGVMWESQGREKTQPDQKEPDPTTNGQRGIQRGERVIWMDLREELVVRVGFGD